MSSKVKAVHGASGAVEDHPTVVRPQAAPSGRSQVGLLPEPFAAPPELPTPAPHEQLRGHRVVDSSSSSARGSTQPQPPASTSPSSDAEELMEEADEEPETQAETEDDGQQQQKPPSSRKPQGVEVVKGMSILAPRASVPLTTLTVLDLSGLGLESVAGVDWTLLPSLEVLSLAHNRLTSLEGLATTEWLPPSLWSLDLRDNRLASLAPLSGFSALGVLELGYNGLRWETGAEGGGG
eukprot:RCo030408